MEELPMACSLEATEFQERLREIAALGAEALLESELDEGRRVLWFREDAAVRGRLERVVEAERRCCPFLEFDLGSRGGRLRLAIAAPPDGEAIAAGLAKAFRA